jgi:hypothetical protein
MVDPFPIIQYVFRRPPDFDRDEDGSSVLSTSIFIKTEIVHFTDRGGTLTIERAEYIQSKGRPVLFRE